MPQSIEPVKLLKADQTIKRIVSFSGSVLSVQNNLAPLSNPITVQFSKVMESCEGDPRPISYFEVSLQSVGNKK